MNNIEQLEEKIAQLTNLVKSESETIKFMEAALRAAEEERDRLRRESEPKFEITQGEKYYFINFLLKGIGLTVQEDIYKNVLRDKAKVDQNNCFKTEERAKEVLDKINLLLKLERLHDIYCPDYKPDWETTYSSKNYKYYIRYNILEAEWQPCDARTVKDAIQVYFPTCEIAQKVCDVLNNESVAN